MTNNQGITHYAPRPFPAATFCGSRRAIAAVRTIEDFRQQGKPCQRCAAKLAKIAAAQARRQQAPAAAPAFRLVNEATGREVVAGDTVTTFRGETGVLQSFSAPRHTGSSGRVTVSFAHGAWSQEFFPGVIGCRIQKAQ